MHSICRFTDPRGGVRIGLVLNSTTVLDLSPAGIDRLRPLLESSHAVAQLTELAGTDLPRLALADLRLCPPVEAQEIWAAGVTYSRSKAARMEESDFSATAYDRVYAAERPELFFKALAEKVVGPGEAVGIRRDARWSVPEPELALVFNSRGELAGYTVGNDMSSRDIEGENLLYLPQAKIYEGSCALGPWITLGPDEPTARSWDIKLEVHRHGGPVFTGETSVSRLRRSFSDLADFLFRSQRFPHGAILLTGTGIIPPDDFTLTAGDEVEIRIGGIGTLRNHVVGV